jgi:hypothetical protein
VIDLKKRSFDFTLFRIVRIMLILVLLSAWLLCGLFAKYASTARKMAEARIATFTTLEVYEHKAELENGVYTLDINQKVSENEYDTVLPGVDIAKDSFIELTHETEVLSYLYVKVVEENLPDTITYEMADGWELLDTEENAQTHTTEKVYVYEDLVGPNFGSIVYLLKDNQLKVSEEFDGNNDFEITFTAYLGQKNAGDDAEDVYETLF